VPLASTNTALSTHLEEPPEVGDPAPAPFDWESAVDAKLVCSQILTVRSKEADASMVPNSG
jgi:hypothetical protein